jgi:peptidylprolyl isomerase
MKVKNNDWVSVKYEGSFPDKQVFDKNDEKNPLYFQVGSGQVIPGFEKAVLDMSKDEEKTVTIKAKEAYGEKNTLVTEIPKEAFAGQDLEKIPLNSELQIMSNMGPLVIEVKEVLKDKVKAIINHPMSGKDLTFKIKLLKILDKQEVEKIMQEMSKHSCSCCSDSECECEEEGHDCECEHEHKHKEEKKKGKK